MSKKQRAIPTYAIRRADAADRERIERMIGFQARQIFGDVDVEEVICKSYLTLLLEDEEGAVGAITVNNYTNVPSVAPWTWHHWIKKLYGLEATNSWNTVFLHLAVWRKGCDFVFLALLMRQLFVEHYHLEHVVLVAPPGVIEVEWLENVATRILPKGYSEPYKVQTLYLMVRQNFVPKYTLRRAVEEDNDDIVPLIHDHSRRLREIYGEFYVSEILTRHQDSGRQIVVAEHSNTVVAVLSLNGTVDLDELNEQFELLPFYGLRKPDRSDCIERLKFHLHEDEEEEHDHDVRKLPSVVSVPPSTATVHTSSSSDIFLDEDSLESAASEDDFTIVDVSSIHLQVGALSSSSYSLGSNASTLSVMLLSASEEFTQGRQRADDELSALPPSQRAQQQKTIEVPEYKGETDAFVIEVAAALPEHEEAALMALLEAAFDCFPGRDYCVVGIPSTVREFPLLRYFVRASQRPVCTYQQELYVLHRNAIGGALTVREARRGDFDDIEDLLSTIPKRDAFLRDFRAALEGTTLEAYVLRSEQRVVGAAVLQPEPDLEHLRTHYQLDYWFDEKHHKTGCYGNVEQLTLSPVFQKHVRFFLTELHRLADFSVLFYRVRSGDKPLGALLGDLLFVKPKVKVEEWEATGGHFALHCSTLDTCSLPRIEINDKIVVVGSSETAIAFLESLLYGCDKTRRVTFTNVTMVAPHGLNHQRPPNIFRDMMFTVTSNLCYKYLQMHQMRTFLNMINGALTQIDRKQKKIVVNDECTVSYDLLILACGEQFQKPNTGKKTFEYPDNVFMINTEVDAVCALTYLKNVMRKNWKNYMVVYGHNLRALCCIASLLEYGVPPERLVFVEPFPPISESCPPHAVSCFNDSDVDARVLSGLVELGVTVHSGYRFLEWNYNKDGSVISSVKFESKHRLLELECLAYFVFAEKSISRRTFLAINKAGLVYDGSLVIGPDCCTNDPRIYAAGTITKYSRKYYADHKSHKYYNAYEIGSKLGDDIRELLLPIQQKETEKRSTVTYGRKKGSMLVPTYARPLCDYCVLPGKLHYLSVRKPGPQVPLESSMSSDSYGHVLVTGSCRSLHEKGYFRLHLNEHRLVETITCLSLEPIDRVNLTSLYGKHESLLNNLSVRFDMLMIPDFYDYFREPWICAIYHDRFPAFQAKAVALMESLGESEGESLIDEVFAMLKENDFNRLNRKQMATLEEKFKDSPYKNELVRTVLEFIRENLNDLSMYAHPIIVDLILQDYINSPCFSEL